MKYFSPEYRAKISAALRAKHPTRITFTPEMVAAYIEMRAAGLTLEQCAPKIGVNVGTLINARKDGRL